VVKNRDSSEEAARKQRETPPGGAVLNIEKGQWHSLKCLESGTVLFEAKDGAYYPLKDDEILSVQP